MTANRKPTSMPQNARVNASSNGADELPFDLPPAPTESKPAIPASSEIEHSSPEPETQREPNPKNAALPRLSISERAIQARGSSTSNNTPRDYLANLNAEQRQAVETLDGPLLVLAGAGTGKTRVLTTRIAHILATRRAYPSQILAVTFTNKAAREMRNRVDHLLDGDVDGTPWLGTFHAICVKILRRHAELVGLKSSFTILDTDDQIRLIKQVLDAELIDKDRWPARQFAAILDDWKNRGLTPDKVPKGEAAAFGQNKGRELYIAYQARLKDLNAADFGDLLLECLRLFTERPDILTDYHKRFKFILVDEYQDTNVAQYLWLRLLAQGCPNICCVGDDDQSIYGWRGAEVDNILRFEKDFKGAAIIRLERNYRSTGHILGAAAGLISANKNRLGKTLFTDDEPGEKVSITSHWDDEEEARNIASHIETRMTSGENLNEIAVLVRAASQMRVLEDRFMTVGIPYRVIGGPRFYERAEIKDAIAYLGVTANPSNDLRFERIANVPKRGLGDTSLKRVREHARRRKIPMYDAALEIIRTDELTKRARSALSNLLQFFERWRSQLESMRHTELAELILDESGYTNMWKTDKNPQSASRLDNLKELVRFMHDFETLDGFLEHVSLVMAADQANDGERVSIMTLHAAKGLEFDTVFLPGFEEGLFPHQRSLDEEGVKGLEEERRLAYVGITRAKNTAKISFAQNRRTRGLYQSAIPSRFIDELPEDHVEIVETATANHVGSFQNAAQGFSRPGYAQNISERRFGAHADPYAANYDTPGWQRAKRQTTGEPNKNTPGRGNTQKRKSSAPRVIEGKVLKSEPIKSDFTCGERVFHQKFGYGRINAIDGDKLTIDFEKSGKKHVIDCYVERH